MENQYTIQQLSQKTGLSVHTLRYYERIGLLEGVPRDEHGYRLYRESDLLWVEFLMRLRGTGMPISEMKRFSDLRSEGDSTITERREMLEAHQAHIHEQMRVLRDHLRSIDDKIDHYKGMEKEQNQAVPPKVPSGK